MLGILFKKLKKILSESRERLFFLKMLVKKDFSQFKSIYILIFSLSVILSFYAKYDAEMKSYEPESDDMEDREIYLISSLVFGLSVISMFWIFLFYGSEFAYDTIKTLSLYSLNINDISFGKLISATISTIATSFLVIIFPLMIFLSVTNYLPMEFLFANYFFFLMALIVINLFSFQISSIILYYYPKIRLLPSTASYIFTTISLVLTKTSIIEIGYICREFLSWGENDPEWNEKIHHVADVISPYSFFHLAGQLSSKYFGENGSVDILILFLLSAFVIPLGIIRAKKIYWHDIFNP